MMLAMPRSRRSSAPDARSSAPTMRNSELWVQCIRILGLILFVFLVSIIWTLGCKGDASCQTALGVPIGPKSLNGTGSVSLMRGLLAICGRSLRREEGPPASASAQLRERMWKTCYRSSSSSSQSMRSSERRARFRPTAAYCFVARLGSGICNSIISECICC